MKQSAIGYRLPRRRGNAGKLFDEHRTTTYIARTGARRALEALSKVDREVYADAGSFATVSINAVTAPL